jgi:hypothetical protein
VNNSTTPIFCPGKCNAGWRAAERRYETTGIDHDLEPRDGQPVWCPPCITSIRAALADMPSLAVALREEVESGVSAAMAEFVSGSKNRPIHDHEAASFLLDEFTEWIAGWEDTVREALGLNLRRTTVNRLITIDGAVALLLPHLDWHLGGRCEPEWDHLHAPDWTGADIATDFGRDALRYHRRAQHLTGSQESEPVRVAGVPCPICDYKALEHEVETEAGRRQRITRYRYGADGEVLTHLRPRPDKITEQAVMPMQGAATGYIRCRKCKPTFRMTPDEYHAWTRLLAAGDEVRALATHDKLVEIFGGSVPAQYRAAR